MNTINNALLSGYDNSTLLNYNDMTDKDVTFVKYGDLPKTKVSGVLKANFYKDGELTQVYSSHENHVVAIAGTRLGKTTSYVIPTVLSLANQIIKRSMIISDPKGEIYKHTADLLRKKGYRVKLLNFRNHMHSECWNMLTPIYRKYHKINDIYNEVKLVVVDGVPYNEFRGKIYVSQEELDCDIENIRAIQEEDVGNDIDNVSAMFIVTERQDDPYWEDSARELLRAFLWAMLEDSVDPEAEYPITEETYSFSTILRVMASFCDESASKYDDNGYFTSRGRDSRAYQLAKNCIIENASGTRKCVVSIFNAKMSVFRETAMRLITSCNSFEISELAEGPIALFIDYRDELKSHYQVISLFVQDAYRYLIERANDNESGRLDVPFYFILDEFGNFPKIRDFETTISACAGRNIFFILIIQSYAQLNNVYGSNVAEIIRDNLNVHVFLGSNNPETLEKFSEECGQKTRISPLSAFNGKGEDMENYQIEHIPLVPKSRLAHFEEGECIITEANCRYVLFSRLERYYKCPEFTTEKLCREDEYICSVNPYDKKYIYNFNSD